MPVLTLPSVFLFVFMIPGFTMLLREGFDRKAHNEYLFFFLSLPAESFFCFFLSKLPAVQGYKIRFIFSFCKFFFLKETLFFTFFSFCPLFFSVFALFREKTWKKKKNCIRKKFALMKVYDILKMVKNITFAEFTQ